jgi:hypothetical protein
MNHRQKMLLIDCWIIYGIIVGCLVYFPGSCGFFNVIHIYFCFWRFDYIFSRND